MWDFGTFKVINIGTDRHPCVQIRLKNVHFDPKDSVSAHCNAVLGPHFESSEEQKKYMEVRELIKRTLDEWGQIRFVIEKKDVLE